MNNKRFKRIESLFGPEGMERLNQAKVVLVGLGAVGGHAAEALARSGIGHLRLVDFDLVRPTNMNRQLLALESTLERPKVEVARDRILDINPDCRVEIFQSFVHVETMDLVLHGNPDVIVDAIDSVKPKVELLCAARQRGITIFSSMGAALRRDPACVRTGPLYEVVNCPLARTIRKKIRQRSVCPDMNCVYSIEKLNKLPVTAITDPLPDDFDHIRRGRIRKTLGSLPTLTGIFGLTLANMTIMYLIDRNCDSNESND